jgi:erythromycin esterase
MKFSLIVILISCLPAVGQSVLEKYVISHVQKVTSIEPEDTNYADLDSFKEAIGDSRVVMLGEQDHGDGATFLAKTRLIKYLHEKLGFKVLAFESDFFGLLQGWELSRHSDYNIDNLIQDNIFPVWTKCSQCANLFNYLKINSSKTNALIISGFDSQLMGKLTHKELIEQVANFIDTCSLPVFQDNKNKNAFFQQLTTLLDYYKNITEKSQAKTIIIKSFMVTIDTVINQLLRKYPEDNFYCALMKSLKGAYRQMVAEIDKDPFSADQIRDEQMAENLEWLILQKFPKEKIIVWAANSHIMKNYFKSSKPASMGYKISQHKELRDLTYIIGFTGKTGTTGRILSKPYNIPASKKESLEQWIGSKEFDYAYVDFKNFRNQFPTFRDGFFMKWIHWQNEKANWINVFDGVFYIKHMYPCNLD